MMAAIFRLLLSLMVIVYTSKFRLQFQCLCVLFFFHFLQVKWMLRLFIDSHTHISLVRKTSHKIEDDICQCFKTFIYYFNVLRLCTFNWTSNIKRGRVDSYTKTVLSSNLYRVHEWTNEKKKQLERKKLDKIFWIDYVLKNERVSKGQSRE